MSTMKVTKLKLKLRGANFVWNSLELFSHKEEIYSNKTTLRVIITSYINI